MDSETHKKVCKAILGKSYPKIDKFLDLYFQVNPSRHREMWGHNPILPLYIFLLGKPEIARAVMVHHILDSIPNTKKNKSFISLFLKYIGD